MQTKNLNIRIDPETRARLSVYASTQLAANGKTGISISDAVRLLVNENTEPLKTVLAE